MLVTITSYREIKGHYNYKVKDQWGNTYIVKDLCDKLELNKQYDLPVETKVNNNQDNSKESNHKNYDSNSYYKKTYGMTKEEIEKHMKTFDIQSHERGHQLEILMLANKLDITNI